MRREWKVQYEELLPEELAYEERHLLEEAKAAAERAYAPYSRFPVGAAVRLIDGRIFTGNNQENAAFPSGLCAERTVLFYVGSQALITQVEAMAVFAPKSDGPVMPCGACRQVIHEYQTHAQRAWVLIFAGASETVYRFVGVENLLPFAFLWRPS